MEKIKEIRKRIKIVTVILWVSFSYVQLKFRDKNVARYQNSNCTSFYSISEDVFLPKSESDLENGEMDEVERELEEFKR